MLPQSLAILNLIDAKTELFRQGTSGEYILLRTEAFPGRRPLLRISLYIRLAAAPLTRTRFTLKPSDVNPDGLILLRLPDGLPLSLAELRLELNHTRGPVYPFKIVPNRKDRLWKEPLPTS